MMRYSVRKPILGMMAAALFATGCGPSAEVSMWHGREGSSHTSIQFINVSSGSSEAGKTGVEWLREKNWTEAEQSFRRAVENNPSDDKALFGLAVALEKQERLPEAIERYQQAAQESEPRSEAHRRYRAAANRAEQARQPGPPSSR